MNFFKVGISLFLVVANFSEATLPSLYTIKEGNFDFQKIVSKPNLSLTEREAYLINHVETSVSLAEKHISQLNPAILEIEGMSSTKNRCLLNNLLTLPNANYLEIGCWKGSTFISALYHNEETVNTATAIDNWSAFGGPYKEFKTNCSHHIGNISYNFYSHDCFSIDPKTFITTPINVYFFDGAHDPESQENAFTFYNSVLDDVFICLVDDWNWDDVRKGTFNAFSKLNYEILYETYLPARYPADLENWWNGFYIAIIRR